MATSEGRAPVSEESVVLRGADAVVRGLRSLYAMDVVHLRVEDTAPEPELRLTRFEVGPLRVDRVRLPYRFSFRVSHFPDFAATTVTAGRAAVTSAGRHARLAAGEVCVPCDPGGGYEGRVDGTVCETVVLDPALLRDVAGLAPEGDELRLDRLTPDGPRATALWTATSRHAHDMLASGPVSVLVADALARTLAAAALTAFPNSFTARSPYTAGPNGLGSAAAHRAMAFMDDNAHRPVTLTDIAAAAGTAPRALQHAFRRRYGVAPMAYLRRVRLARAHAELQAADPRRGVRVQDVSARWGWSSPGNFATAYRRAYGRSPSATLNG
ncbi:AraC family transcriptional regulator [Streptomyces sp. NPDC097619]|uniref:AraC family transcriptional regulator n=1 Tax=Streptomyces sp. NPDC097619 TaxID=3157228 RepID=UPI00331FB63A